MIQKHAKTMKVKSGLHYVKEICYEQIYRPHKKGSTKLCSKSIHIYSMNMKMELRKNYGDNRMKTIQTIQIYICTKLTNYRTN